MRNKAHATLLYRYHDIIGHAIRYVATYICAQECKHVLMDIYHLKTIAHTALIIIADIEYIPCRALTKT